MAAPRQKQMGRKRNSESLETEPSLAKKAKTSQGNHPGAVSGQLKRPSKAAVPNFSKPQELNLRSSSRDLGFLKPPLELKPTDEDFRAGHQNPKDHSSCELDVLHWPKISFGDDTPQPRWLVTRDRISPSRGENLSDEVDQSQAGPAIPTGYALDADTGLGGLVWTFDAGPASGWNQLAQDQLYEYAFRHLEDALKDLFTRDQFRSAILDSPLASIAKNMKDPLPPLPAAPTTCYFGETRGMHCIVNAPTRIGQAMYYLNNYKRPSMTMRPGLQTRPSNMHTLAAKVFHHMKGTLGPPSSQITPENTAYICRTQSAELRRLEESRKQHRVNEYDPERMQDIPTSGRLSPLPLEDGGKIGRIGEYKCVWYSVIVLVLSMFLCLFLYSFKVIR
ncbi:hypothetical protein NUU61_004933 [Penicillium alfredii]|uniref:Uncharacterized protein n=1 Tax=Penicillium alfredii TaxID=1506179 RepID=A0A9W9F8L1_9EURO|nr:uncharacterized protein NUU61_004933 [Penicillium alfredii]KAJ5095577.1 hypothetical protein NUU61_004933 [Penicillium alfredii]